MTDGHLHPRIPAAMHGLGNTKHGTGKGVKERREGEGEHDVADSRSVDT
jgi:hypothetical protein